MLLKKISDKKGQLSQIFLTICIFVLTALTVANYIYPAFNKIIKKDEDISISKSLDNEKIIEQGNQMIAVDDICLDRTAVVSEISSLLWYTYGKGVGEIWTIDVKDGSNTYNFTTNIEDTSKTYSGQITKLNELIDNDTSNSELSESLYTKSTDVSYINSKKITYQKS